MQKDNNMIYHNLYQVQKKISAGSFGVVYLGENIQTLEQVAIKVEKNNNEDEILSVLREATILQKMSNIGERIPHVYWSGTQGFDDVMVITLMGKDLGSYLKIFKTFSVKTVIQLADQLITALEQVHSCSIIHRDIKPENIVMGRKEFCDTVYFIDFGISKYFKDSRGKHIPMKDKKAFIGTTRYASISAHQGIELSRKDDLESLGYVLIFMLKGQLPWQNLNVSDKEKTKRVGEQKAKINVEELCKDLPVEFANYMSYVKSLVFTETPDYNYLRGLMKQIATQQKITFDNKWDWSTSATKRTTDTNTKITSNRNCGSFMEEKKFLGVIPPKVSRAGSSSNLLSPELNSQIENTYNSKSAISQCASIRVDKNCNDLDHEEYNLESEESKEFTAYPIKNVSFKMAQLEAKKVKAQFFSFERKPASIQF